ncbi:MAG: glutamine synthetase III [Spirochaetales bacterium]|nr:glutamine synthetase III [Spirochaetales bacterium]
MNTIDFIKTPVNEIYGCNSFNDIVMRERLPKSIYKEVKKVQKGTVALTQDVAEVVAYAMKDWAIEKGATHFTHWFQPLTGLTAEKHDSFISPTPEGGVIMEFSGKELIKGEPDASSFPSGGLRVTFEARGYTAWDVNSPAFVVEDISGVTLYIPTAFISYTGEALDKKVPLLRSMDVVGKHALRILKTFGSDAEQVTTTVGAEQEYFLVDKELADERPDLLLAGRTVFGTMPAKGQEMDDHYFGSIKERAATFMKELNYELWKLGISAKTQHNEVAPNQFEIAPIFESANAAADKNQLTMNVMKKVATRQNMVCLLHEKPFSGVNGSGKHNNWSLSTDTGVNLLEPGENPQDNAQFLVFLMAIIKAVDIYAPLLRTSAANSGNDHRLGANEAPPAIISIFLGDQLSGILESLTKDEKVPTATGEELEIGFTLLPKLPKDLTDRNRTSPFAFTGNKFEFRMVPSSGSIATPNTVLNTAVASVLDEFAGLLESSSDINKTITDIVKETYKHHSKVIFNGNGYSDDWIAEAESRGLANITSTVAAIPEYTKPYSVELFEKYNILSRAELESRSYVYFERYSQQINIEANMMLEMADRHILPAAATYITELSSTIISAREASPGIQMNALEATLNEVNNSAGGLHTASAELKSILEKVRDMDEEESQEIAEAYRDEVFAKMEELRLHGDKLETMMPAELWPFPTYMDLLFRL